MAPAGVLVWPLQRRSGLKGSLPCFRGRWGCAQARKPGGACPHTDPEGSAQRAHSPRRVGCSPLLAFLPSLRGPCLGKAPPCLTGALGVTLSQAACPSPALPAPGAAQAGDFSSGSLDPPPRPRVPRGAAPELLPSSKSSWWPGPHSSPRRGGLRAPLQVRVRPGQARCIYPAVLATPPSGQGQ